MKNKNSIHNVGDIVWLFSSNQLVQGRIHSKITEEYLAQTTRVKYYVRGLNGEKLYTRFDSVTADEIYKTQKLAIAGLIRK